MQPNSPSSIGLKLEWMDPYELAENPLNPRYHPQAQRRSLHAALQSLGWLQPLLYNQRTGRLIDGHLRRQEAIESGITEVPVLVVDLDESIGTRGPGVHRLDHRPGRGGPEGVRPPAPHAFSKSRTIW